MVLNYSGFRHLTLCCLQTKFCFPGLENQCSLHLTLRTEVQYAWLILHYSHMCGWKLSGITFDWLVYFSGLNFSKWSRQLCIWKYRICVMYRWHYLWIMCVYKMCVSKWFMWWNCASQFCIYVNTGIVLYSPVPSFVTVWENQCSLHLALGTEVQYAWLHEQYYTTVTCLVGYSVALLLTD